MSKHQHKAASSANQQTSKPIVTTEVEKPVTEVITITAVAEETAIVANDLVEDIIVAPVMHAKVTEAPPPVVEKTIVIEEASAPRAENAETMASLETILKDVPAAYRTEISRIVTYCQRMAPRHSLDPKAALAEQVALYRAIQNIINRQDVYFTQLFTAVLFLFKQEYCGALGDKYRMRFMDNINLPAGDRKAFACITQMLNILADGKSRQAALSQINMQRALENGLSEEGRMRVLNYFNL